MLTISKLKRWSINYYIDTAQAADTAARDLSSGRWRTGGVLLRARNPIKCWPRPPSGSARLPSTHSVN